MPIRKRSGISISSGASLSDMILSKKNELLNIISQGSGSSLESALQDLGYYVSFLDILYDSTAMNAIASSSTAMNAIASSSTAINAIINSHTALDAVVSSSTAMNAIINSQTALNAIKDNSTAWSIFTNSNVPTVKEVPPMTSNTAPEGVASASSINSSEYDVFRVFDKDTSTDWWAAGVAPQWVQYKFVSPVFVHTVTILGYSSAGNGYNPVSVTIQASNDGSNFTDVATFNQEFTYTSTTTLYLNKAGYYQYWRVRINSTVNSSYEPDMREVNFKGFIQPT